MRGEALRWLSEARWDLETAGILHRSGRFNAACFYAHQAAEKAVKALLYRLNEAPWGHSVRVPLDRYIEKSGDEAAAVLLDSRWSLIGIIFPPGIQIHIPRGRHSRHMTRLLPLGHCLRPGSSLTTLGGGSRNEC